MITGVDTLEAYLKEHENRLQLTGQVMGRALYLTRNSPGGLLLDEVEKILDEFDGTSIPIGTKDWFIAAMQGIYAGMLYAKDINNIILDARRR